MPEKVKVLVLRTAGTNCDQETAHAFSLVGANADLVHINRLKEKEVKLNDYHILALPGGFTYGDDVASGKVLANELRYGLGEELDQFIEAGKLIIGICNGFQVLVKAGILPEHKAGDFDVSTTLTYNDSGKFEDRWVYLKSATEKCVWTKDLAEIIYLPVAHGEGKFMPEDNKVLEQLKKQGQIVFRYVDSKGKAAKYPENPNNSVDSIAGICDPTGRIFGLMPHPERHVHPASHPRWTREGLKSEGDGLAIFRNGVDFVAENLI
ncbi:MAG: phosphoribosylformylglycinamidine synthase I [Candidatus Omnitrophica bacterium]|nr:phosphoribosylformylglycinamidine synthase I [Candidatus Omnitrophota bacterium]